MTDNNEVRGKAVAWATNGGKGQRLDETFIASNKRYVETHRDYDWHGLVLASDYAALQAEIEALRADARLLVASLSGAFAAMDMQPTPAAAPLIEKYRAPEPEPKRYVCLKASGSRFAYVNDTHERRTVKRYDICRHYGGLDGWTCATEHANSLNAADRALEQEGKRDE